MTGAPRAAILAACDALEAARERLCQLDAVAGDGDHGVTMALAARAVRSRLEGISSDEPADLLQQVGLAVATAGGTIGAIYGIGLGRAASALRIEGGRELGPTLAAHTCAEAALEAVMRVGKVAPGDKTVVDALEPFVVALGDAVSRGLDLEEALPRAVLAAEAGAAATTGMTARAGRAARLGDRSLGSPDAGATSLALALRAAAQAYLGRPLGDDDGMARAREPTAREPMPGGAA